MFCQKCGTEVVEGSKCPNCGQVANEAAQTVVIQQNTVPAKSSKKKVTAGLLCFLLGIFGAHRFYVGKVGTGILWLLTAGMFGIGAFIDLLYIIFGGFKDKYGMRLS